MKTRMFFSIGFIFCSLMLSGAYFLQYALGLEPCPLCILERMVVFVLLALFGLAALRPPKKIGCKIMALLISGVSFFGLGLAARHVYLQHLPPDKIPDCGPGFDYLIKNFPLSEVFTLLFQGSGQCAKIGTKLLGLSLAQWSGVAFACLLAWGLAPFFGAIKEKA